MSKEALYIAQDMKKQKMKIWITVAVVVVIVVFLWWWTTKSDRAKAYLTFSTGKYAKADEKEGALLGKYVKGEPVLKMQKAFNTWFKTLTKEQAKTFGLSKMPEDGFLGDVTTKIIKAYGAAVNKPKPTGTGQEALGYALVTTSLKDGKAWATLPQYLNDYIDKTKPKGGV